MNIERIEFQAWPKISRLNRDIVITEKIDGTNAAVGIKLLDELPHITTKGWTEDVEVTKYSLFDDDAQWGKLVYGPRYPFVVYAQSRTRLINLESDNFGFAKWVHDNALALAMTLGPGLHFGEYWGAGIQRRYGLKEKRFSLFNTPRYSKDDFKLEQVPGLETVPVLYEGLYSQQAIDNALDMLRRMGSAAAPGFDDPEGIVVFHTAAQTAFKITLKNDEAPKGLSGV